ncbi:metal ABC transporter solute-binding protein, Zn/Mn family [Pyrobaculum sp.]|uniref:metal ABC transporter solute-binding protein, Zn/Mn family n=1 Tax=Pyrobaculum sp. TaxID=2004705 RepID=UPI003D118DB5
MSSKTPSPRLAAGALVALVLATLTSAATIVVSFPAYDTVLREAFPQANVVLLTKGAGDPHEYQLTAEDLKLLTNLTSSDVVVLSMHAPFELKIAEMAKEGKIKARVIDLTKIQIYLTFDGKLVRPDQPGVSGVNPHDHGLYPPNVIRLVEEVSRVTGLRPSEDFVNRLRQLNATYCCKFAGRAVALTPAAQYLLYWLGFRDIAVFVKEPGVPPTPDDLQKALQYAREGAPVVAAVVRGEAMRVVNMFSQKAREAGIQPNVVVADFSKGEYLSSLEKFAAEVAKLYTATSSAKAEAPTSTTPVQTGATGAEAPREAQPTGSDQSWLWLAAAVVVAVGAFAAGFLALRKRRR